METKRAFTAVILSLFILLGYQYFFMPAPQQLPPAVAPQNEQAKTAPEGTSTTAIPVTTSSAVVPSEAQSQQNQLSGKDIAIETNRYLAVISENGGVIKSFKLKDYRETSAKDSPPKELIFTQSPNKMPFSFAWGNGIPAQPQQYKTNQSELSIPSGSKDTLTMTAEPMPGLSVTRNMTFTDNSYQIDLEVQVSNNTDQALQGAPFLENSNKPFSTTDKSAQRLFTGPAIYLDKVLQEIKIDTLKKEGQKTLTGMLSWAAYEDSYFLCSIIPQPQGKNTVQLALSGDDQVTSTINGEQEIIPVGGKKSYHYTLFIGPKKLSILQATGFDLDKIINFGWFDVIAKPTLFLLNFLYKYLHNYGIAIILVTVFFKLLFWPISHKGMKSMKTMQKIQPKMAKLREKYADDKERLNQEMMNLYKTYKINPLGGCLPMVLQIPVFFALYKVLLQTIELRHAPFMLWMTDLSAPDRLFIGFDIPGLGGIPVLTLLMGATMFLQQKMTPTTGDPTQAKVMMFLPVIFTFMFLNFASGLVLYWFVNNLLSIGQQYFINRSIEP
ncbi:MAG: membrane protein insertase YidC [Desulfobulbaceae bacterium]|nr:membrane protein insertase YidC [Desulfobulbaceae bacterium]